MVLCQWLGEMFFYLDFCSYFETTGWSCFTVLLGMRYFCCQNLSPKGRKNSHKKTDQVYLMTSLQIPSDTWKSIWATWFCRPLRFTLLAQTFINLGCTKSSLALRGIIGKPFSNNHKHLRGLKRVTRVRCSWIFTFAIFGYFRACLHEGGGPQVGEVTLGKSPHLTCKRDHIKMRDYMDRRVTPPKRVTSPTWGPPPPCKQALSEEYQFSAKWQPSDHHEVVLRPAFCISRLKIHR